jgi:hypothetical protein
MQVARRRGMKKAIVALARRGDVCTGAVPQTYRRFDFSRKSRLPNEFGARQKGITPLLLEPRLALQWR